MNLNFKLEGWIFFFCSAVKKAAPALTIVSTVVKSRRNYNKNALCDGIDVGRRKGNHHEIHRFGILQNKQAFI